jgi:hypothetical protein
MGSRPRDSTRKRKPRSAKAPKSASKPSSPPAETERVEEAAEDVVGQLDDTRSILSAALKALDNIDERDEHRVNAPVVCRADDVATVLRIGLACLEDARDALQTRVVEGKP